MEELAKCKLCGCEAKQIGLLIMCSGAPKCVLTGCYFTPDHWRTLHSPDPRVAELERQLRESDTKVKNFRNLSNKKKEQLKNAESRIATLKRDRDACIADCKAAESVTDKLYASRKRLVEWVRGTRTYIIQLEDKELELERAKGVMVKTIPFVRNNCPSDAESCYFCKDRDSCKHRDMVHFLMKEGY